MYVILIAKIVYKTFSCFHLILAQFFWTKQYTKQSNYGGIIIQFVEIIMSSNIIDNLNQVSCCNGLRIIFPRIALTFLSKLHKVMISVFFVMSIFQSEVFVFLNELRLHITLICIINGWITANWIKYRFTFNLSLKQFSTLINSNSNNN